MSSLFSCPPKNTVRLQLVIDDSVGPQEKFEVVDVVRFIPIDVNTYIVEFSPFHNDKVKNGAGPDLTEDQIKSIIENLTHDKGKKRLFQ